MDHHADLVFLQPEHLGDFFIEYVIDNLHFEEVIPRSERTALLGPARQGVIADQFGVGVVDPPLRFGVGNILLGGKIAAQEIARPFGEESFQFASVELVSARPSDAGWNVAEQIFDKFAQVRLNITIEKIGTNQSDAAIYIVADSARRNHSIFGWIGRGDTTYAEAVAPVNIRHRQAGRLNARQEGDIRHLLRRLVITKLCDGGFVREDNPIDLHARLVALRDSPTTFVHALQWATE